MSSRDSKKCVNKLKGTLILRKDKLEGKVSVVLLRTVESRAILQPNEATRRVYKFINMVNKRKEQRGEND